MKARVPLVIVSVAVAIVVVGAIALFVSHDHPSAALADSPRGVTVIVPEPAAYRAQRRYVGAVYPWLTANIGPQLVSAMVEEVYVRPGDQVPKGMLLAKLACQHVAANTQALTASAKASAARDQALAAESKRLGEMAKLGFVSENERQKKMAESAAESAQLASAQARTLSGSIEQSDCLLHAPFAGEIADRFVDPGVYVRPGTALLTLIDRTKVRIVTDVPEIDYDVVAPGVEANIRLLATGQAMKGIIARRSPSADGATRTIHCEIDIANDARTLPTGTTAEVRIEVGTPTPAMALPLTAATVRGKKVTVFVVEGDVAHQRTLTLLGEHEGQLFVAGDLPPQSRIVAEGRASLNDGDRVHSVPDPFGKPGEPSDAPTPKSDGAAVPPIQGAP